jgi:hypothetical protein
MSSASGRLLKTASVASIRNCLGILAYRFEKARSGQRCDQSG